MTAIPNPTAGSTPTAAADHLHGSHAGSFVPLPAFSRRYVELTGENCPLGYRRIVDLACSAKLPAIQRNGRWGLLEGDIPQAIAAVRIVAGRPAKPSIAA